MRLCWMILLWLYTSWCRSEVWKRLMKIDGGIYTG